MLLEVRRKFLFFGALVYLLDQSVELLAVLVFTLKLRLDQVEPLLHEDFAHGQVYEHERLVKQVKLDGQVGAVFLTTDLVPGVDAFPNLLQ